MGLEAVLMLAALMFLAALLYSSVGHAGASGYLAAMALFGLAPLVMKPTALMLNVVVASIASYRFLRAGCFSRELFWPLALAAVPMAFVGGLVTLPPAAYRPLLGLVLLYSAWRFLARPVPEAAERRPPALPWLLAAGAGIGLLSGLTGVGGGIFLSPLALFLAWGRMREVAGVSALFILVNSLAGLAGFFTRHGMVLPEGFPVWAVAVVLGGWLGAGLGSRRLPVATLQKVLALVLAVAGGKMLLTL
ncbi:MAG: sulfite exporter TauE/SafE family protein [Pseudomonadota bacterium]